MPESPVARGQPTQKHIVHSANSNQTPTVCRAGWRSRECGFQERGGPRCQGALI